jgi:hypothetical protein
MDEVARLQPLPESVVSLAQSVAWAHGDSAPRSLAYVRSTRRKAVELIAGHDPSPPEATMNESVWLLQLSGDFTPRRGPLGHHPEAGPFMHLVVDVQTETVTDLSIGDSAPDLGLLGVPGAVGRLTE